MKSHSLFRILFFGLRFSIVVIQIMRKVADTLIPRTLELGGKYPFIVCEDVAQAFVRANLQSSGQNCVGAEKFYVHKDARLYTRNISIVPTMDSGMIDECGNPILKIMVESWKQKKNKKKKLELPSSIVGLHTAILSLKVYAS
ncbi:hypothetical protein L6452_38555 [Arctium lappa]|uniref:Uncharacterized protein n=1 Tax=Arctium lappa TaxID=4217 RepID=A0ACB8XRL9_ARCLA|nr:hypothetical protein L6452_38555 [Arctium lappa]